eukprot:154850-Prymnesium_polylepis.1
MCEDRSGRLALGHKVAHRRGLVQAQRAAVVHRQLPDVLILQPGVERARLRRIGRVERGRLRVAERAQAEREKRVGRHWSTVRTRSRRFRSELLHHGAQDLARRTHCVRKGAVPPEPNPPPAPGPLGNPGLL